MSDEQATTAVKEVTEREAEAARGEQERLAADLQHLRDLLEHDRVEEARRFVKELEPRWPESERVKHYAHVLAPPKVRSRPDIPARSLDRERKWLEEHRHEYPGCWLAVYEDRLIAADPDRGVAVAKATEALGEKSFLLFQQPGDSEVQVNQTFIGRAKLQYDVDAPTGNLLLAVLCKVGARTATEIALVDTASQWCILPLGRC